MVLDKIDASGSLTANYVYGDGIDEILTMDKNAQKYFYFYDGLGSVTDITDAQGNLIENYSYDVYGNPSTTSSIGNRYMYTGREYDLETGLYHYRARSYDPSSGRFLQRDPIGYYDSMNLYSYVRNNSINLVDPSGKIVPNLIAAGVGAVIGGVSGGVSAWMNGRNVWAGIGIGAAVGGVTGFTFGAALPSVGTFGTAVLVGGSSGFAGNVGSQVLTNYMQGNNNGIDWRSATISGFAGAGSAIWGGFATASMGLTLPEFTYAAWESVAISSIYQGVLDAFIQELYRMMNASGTCPIR